MLKITFLVAFLIRAAGNIAKKIMLLVAKRLDVMKMQYILSFL